MNTTFGCIFVSFAQREGAIMSSGEVSEGVLPLPGVGGRATYRRVQVLYS